MAAETRTEAPPRAGLAQLAQTVTALRDELLGADRENAELIDSIPPDNRPSARNLLHYVSLRRHDIRQLQVDLAALGLSSLGRAEAHVLSSVEAVAGWLTGQQTDGRPTSHELETSLHA